MRELGFLYFIILHNIIILMMGVKIIRTIRYDKSLNKILRIYDTDVRRSYVRERKNIIYV